MKPTDRLPGIHALRVVAALTVFLLHCLHLTANGVKPVTSIADHLQFGVPLFFAVSAFSLMYTTRPYQGSRGWVERFYLKRFFRIAPLYYLMLLVEIPLQHFVALGQFFPKVPLPDLLSVFLNITFLFGASPIHENGLVMTGWSVGVEMLFYLVFPLLLVWCRNVWSVLALILVSHAVGEFMRPILDPMYNVGFFNTVSNFNVLPNFRYFGYGMLAFLIYDQLRAGPLGSASPSWLRLTAFHLICFALIASLIALMVFEEERLKALWHADMAVWGLIFAVFIVWFALKPLPTLSWAPVQFLGERSYSLYLVHLPTLLLLAPFTQWLFQTLAPGMCGWAIFPTLAGTYAPIVAISAVTYALVERPGMDLGKRLGRGLGERPPGGRAAQPAAMAGD